jgi:hypothetical protein
VHVQGGTNAYSTKTYPESELAGYSNHTAMSRWPYSYRNKYMLSLLCANAERRAANLRRPICLGRL